MKQKNNQTDLKKTYTAPKLQHLGGLKELTKGGFSGTNDMAVSNSGKG